MKITLNIEIYIILYTTLGLFTILLELGLAVPIARQALIYFVGIITYHCMSNKLLKKDRMSTES